MTDPTARHHAQILDWLSAALTDPDTTMIYLHQDADEAGTWEIHTDRKVDPAKEATATSRADEDLLATYDEVESYLEKRYGQPDPAAWNRSDYDDGGVLPGFSGTESRCDDCQDLTKAEWEKALTEDVEWTTTGHGEKITATFTGPGDRLTDLLLAFYGYAPKEN